jgi:bifunctional DNase/RNase
MSDQEDTRIEMEVADLAVDAESGTVVLGLRAENGASLMIAIGFAEGTAIAKELQGVSFSRPLTHDLMRDLLDALGATLRQIEVVALRDETYFAELILEDSRKQVHRVDARPSDAIALALRMGAPIFVHEQVLRVAGQKTQEFPPSSDKEGWRKRLEEMDPEDFGKYKM